MGQICSGGGSCEDGGYCDNTTGQSVCDAVGTSGDSCHHKQGCADGLACIGLSSQSPGHCGAWLDIGESCDPSKTVTGCPLDAPCHQTAHKCQSNASTVGATCSSYCNTIGFKQANVILYCDGSTHECTPREGIGGSCASSDQCMVGVCDPSAMTCQAQCG